MAAERRVVVFNYRFRPENPQPVLIHGHCHQKRLVDEVGTASAGAVPELEFSSLSHHAAGMAGTLGWRGKNVDFSHQMAQQSLVPALQAALSCIGGLERFWFAIKSK